VYVFENHHWLLYRTKMATFIICIFLLWNNCLLPIFI